MKKIYITPVAETIYHESLHAICTSLESEDDEGDGIAEARRSYMVDDLEDDIYFEE